MAEFIKEKRDIFLIQLTIDRTHSETKRIYSTMANSEAEFDRLEKELEQTALEFKMRTSALSTRLTNAAKNVDVARRRNFEGRQKVKRLTASVSRLRSEISHYESQLEKMSLMKDFLWGMSTDGHFADPAGLTDKLDELEESNLRVCEYLGHYQWLFDAAMSDLETGMTETDAMIAVTEAKSENELGQLEDLGASPTSEAQDAELARLTELICHAYRECIGKDNDMLPLLQLERIEVQFNAMCQRLDRVSPDFIRERQLMQEKKRRDQQRIERQEKQDEEQKLKIAQAIERANQPIKRRTGRPVVRRGVPVRREKKNNLKLEALRREQARLENLLYGELYPWTLPTPSKQ
jgi:hypothetical protein